jgi:hypothetical protein
LAGRHCHEPSGAIAGGGEIKRLAIIAVQFGFDGAGRNARYSDELRRDERAAGERCDLRRRRRARRIELAGVHRHPAAENPGERGDAEPGTREIMQADEPLLRASRRGHPASGA